MRVVLNRTTVIDCNVGKGFFDYRITGTYVVYPDDGPVIVELQGGVQKEASAGFLLSSCVRNDMPIA